MFCILALRYDTIRYDSSVLQLKLLLRAYRKSYMRNRLIPKWMTLTFVQRSYQGRVNHSHTMAALRQLHWLSVAYRVQYNICILMQSIVNGTAPVYLRELVQPTIVKWTAALTCAPLTTAPSSNCALGQNSRNERSVSPTQQAGTHFQLNLEWSSAKIPSSDVLKTLF